MVTLVDSYSETNFSLAQYISSVDYEQIGQSFTGTAGSINSCKFDLRKYGSPTGTIRAYLYAHSGTFGTSSRATGSPLASSDTIDVSTLSGVSYELITFNFSSSYTMSEGTKYFISVEYLGGNYSNAVMINIDDTSPTHAGNYAGFVEDEWDYNSGWDVAFYVYKNDAVTTGISINIGDAWKTVTGVQINIGDAWKTVTKGEVNIGDAWKTFYGS